MQSTATKLPTKNLQPHCIHGGIYEWERQVHYCEDFIVDQHNYIYIYKIDLVKY